MDLETKKLIDNGTIICGRIIQENGIVRFERVDPSRIEYIPEDERGFATASMGRAIFTINKDGSIHNFKGVDAHLSTSELGLMNLVNGKSIEYIPRTDGYKISAVVFNDKKPEIRINGTSPLEDIEIEGDINKRLAEMGIKVPTISYIREIPQDFSIKYGLPIKVDGSLDEFESDYAVEDDERKKRLAKIYGKNYSQELQENQRPESMREYLQRIGFLSSLEVQANIESLGYSMQDFIDAVDSSYSRGQRYGQTERIMGSPFRISDLETCMANGNKEQLQTIMDFTEMKNSNFTEQLAAVFGRNIAILMNNGWECENLIHRQDFSLTGEFCDDSYFDIFEKQAEMKEKFKAEPYKADALMNEIRRKYTGQVMHIASCIKVVQNAMSMTGKSQEQIDGILDTFVESFVDNLNLQKIGQLFQIDENAIEETLMSEFRAKQNWTEKMAGQDRREGFVMDEAIYNSHIGNEEFYAKVSEMISERIRTRQIQKKYNPVQCYLDEINKIEIPNDEKNILDFLSSLDGNMQSSYLSFILSQSHIFGSMAAILDTYIHKDFYNEAGYSDRTGKVVPKLDKDGKVYYEEYTSSDSIDKACKTILKSLQGDDKSAWSKFVTYVKSIYEPSKMDIYNNPQLSQMNQGFIEDFVLLSSEIIENDQLRNEISELKNKPVRQDGGFISRIKGFFSQRKRDKEISRKESILQDESNFSEKALDLIRKYKEDKNVSTVMRNQLEFAECLIKAGLPKETFMNVLNGLGRCAESSSYCNYRIFNMLKQLSINATIGKELYSPEILYAKSFQDMTKNIRKLLAKSDLKENSPITTEYRTKPLRNALLASEDISNVLKGKDLSQNEIQAKMVEYDEEFKNILEEENVETYIKRCTDLMMKFVSTHPFDDGNGRTSRMLLQAMLARRGIIFPSNIDNYFERQSGTDYSIMEDYCLRTEDYTQMESYILERAKRFNNGKLVLTDEPLTFEYDDRQKAVEQLQTR